MDRSPAIYLLGADPVQLQALAAQVRMHLAGAQQPHVHSIIDAAQVAVHPCALYLLLGLALRPGGQNDDSARERALRDVLLLQAIDFQVIHAAAPERQAHQALTVIEQRLGTGWVQSWPALPEPAVRQRRWTGPCEKCSDPDCEHRLFQSLLAERT